MLKAEESKIYPDKEWLRKWFEVNKKDVEGVVNRFLDRLVLQYVHDRKNNIINSMPSNYLLRLFWDEAMRYYWRGLRFFCSEHYTKDNYHLSILTVDIPRNTTCYECVVNVLIWRRLFFHAHNSSLYGGLTNCFKTRLTNEDTKKRISKYAGVLDFGFAEAEYAADVEFILDRVFDIKCSDDPEEEVPWGNGATKASKRYYIYNRKG